jgi:hypothetical protein
MEQESSMPAVFFSLKNCAQSFPRLTQLNLEAQTAFPGISADHIIVGLCDRSDSGREIFLSLDTDITQVPGVIGSILYTLEFLNEQRSSLDDVVFFIGEKCYSARPL